MERKGEATERGDTNRDIAATNEGRAEKIAALKAEAAQVGAEIINLAEERAKRAAEKEVFASVRTREPARVLEAITERRSTFTRADLNFALSKDITDAKERSAFMNEVLARDETVPLRDQAHGPITRYTTRAVLKAEGDILQAGRDLVSDTRHGITAGRLADCLDHHAELDQEQKAAVAHATGASGFAVIAGEAGTGKSRTMAAVRDAYEAEGKRVIGMAWTNAVVQDMKGEGFRDPTTIAAELMRQAAGRSHWDRNTILMVDEAAMLATKHLAAVASLARDAGAKLILVGDEKQLASIERGGMFGALKDEHGAAELHTVRRVKDEDQKRAFNQMHRGEYRDALGAFEERGAIHWTADEAAARAALVTKYIEDRQADPTRSAFAFAYTNKEVAALNADIRAKRRELSDLGEDHILPVKDGEAAFATGDRVQFTASARKKADKDAGLTNGMVGTVREIDGHKVTVEIDTKARSKPRLVSFVVGDNAEAGEFNAMRHGYAGTIYKGQGRTLDDTYLLHSKHWRSASSYVALTRHREDVAVFVDQSAAPDLDKLAQQMGRVEEKRAASQFMEAAARKVEGETPLARRYAALHEAHAAGDAKQHPAADPDTIRMYRGVGKNVWAAEPGEAVFFSTDRGRAAAFGDLHYVDITREELAKFEQPHSKRILEAEPSARNDWRTADPDILSRLKALDGAESKGATSGTDGTTGAREGWAASTAAERAAAAQRIAGRVGRITEPTRQANVLKKAHEGDSGRAGPAEPPSALADFLADIKRTVDDDKANKPGERGGAGELPHLPDHLDRYQQQLEERRADMERAEEARAAATACLADDPSNMAALFEAHRTEIAAEQTRDPGEDAERVLTAYAELRREEPAKAVVYLELSYQQEERAQLARTRERGGMTR
jgi:Ti-type conjugative transfer relaxase TraA